MTCDFRVGTPSCGFFFPVPTDLGAIDQLSRFAAGCNFKSRKVKILQFGFGALQPSKLRYLKMEAGLGFGAIVRTA